MLSGGFYCSFKLRSSSSPTSILESKRNDQGWRRWIGWGRAKRRGRNLPGGQLSSIHLILISIWNLPGSQLYIFLACRFQQMIVFSSHFKTNSLPPLHPWKLLWKNTFWIFLPTQVIVTFYIAIVLLLVGVNFRGGGWWRPDRCLLIKIKDHFHKCLDSFLDIHKWLDDVIACCLSQYELRNWIHLSFVTSIILSSF